MTSIRVLPPIIQGGMGIGVSGWRLAEVDNLPGRDGYPCLLRPGVTAEMIIHLNR